MALTSIITQGGEQGNIDHHPHVGCEGALSNTVLQGARDLSI